MRASERIWAVVSPVIFAFLLLPGCGGGSSGTGVPDGFLTKVLTGSVADEQNTPIAGAQLVVLETGDSTSTDSGGRFQLALSANAPKQFNVEVKTGSVTSSVAVSSESGSRTDVQIEVNRRKGTVSAKGLQVLAKIVGACDFAFENNAVIRQANSLKSGTKCPLQVSIRNTAQGLSGIPFKMEHSACGAEAWKPVGKGLTGATGRGTLTFTFFDTEEFCDYRIVAPDHFEGLKSIVFPVKTFRRQAFDKTHPALAAQANVID